jgi:hypothetical protein
MIMLANKNQIVHSIPIIHKNKLNKKQIIETNNNHLIEIQMISGKHQIVNQRKINTINKVKLINNRIVVERERVNKN